MRYGSGIIPSSMPPRFYPRLLLAVLTGLNILNYIDRNVLFAVQSDVKKLLKKASFLFGNLRRSGSAASDKRNNS